MTKERTISFEIKFPIHLDIQTKNVHIPVEVFDNFGEEFLTFESSQKIEEIKRLLIEGEIRHRFEKLSGIDSVSEWFKTPNDALDGECPENLFTTTEGIDRLLRILYFIESGEPL